MQNLNQCLVGQITNFIKMSGLRLGQKIGFGLGCVLNTLCASMWFTLISFYFDQVTLSEIVEKASVILTLDIVNRCLKWTDTSRVSSWWVAFWLMVISRFWSDGYRTSTATLYSACEYKIQTPHKAYIFWIAGSSARGSPGTWWASSAPWSASPSSSSPAPSARPAARPRPSTTQS